MDPARPQPARKNKETYYALALRGDSVLLVQRPADASLMAEMWELPELTPEEINGDTPLLRVRHSITDTDYRVSVFAIAEEPSKRLRDEAWWFTAKQCERLALTGLARKILRKIANESAKTGAESK